ncbi:hypothetical protein BDZ91DRAFT_735695 [Kalaharituber pfeilii]|nr:hypothetical protein BDZ91DRAFT_735695 [Kalaharituber pfeilii]
MSISSTSLPFLFLSTFVILCQSCRHESYHLPDTYLRRCLAIRFHLALQVDNNRATLLSLLPLFLHQPSCRNNLSHL